tara:strand:+ start:3482 stop:3721 length:240 start_codon:yes stop_codon:yes gene_type:complete
MPFDKKNRKKLMPEGMRNPRGRDLSTPLAPSGEFEGNRLSPAELVKLQNNRQERERNERAKMSPSKRKKVFNSTMNMPG